MRRAHLAVVVAAVVALGWVAANGALWYRTADFFCLREGARLVATGQDPYDEALWRATVTTEFPDPLRGSATSSCVARYASPLWTAVMMLPFGVLPLEVSASLWMALGIGATILGTRWIWLAAGGPARLAPVFATLVVTSQPFWVLLVGAQISGLLLGLVGAAVRLASVGREALSGAALAALVVKPQVAAAFVPALVLREALRGRPRALAGAASAALALLAASVIARPDWIRSWLDEVGGRRLGYAGLLPSAWGLSTDVFGTVWWGPALIGLAVAACAVMVRGRALGPVTFAAIALPLSLFAMPHVWSYDFLVLALSWGAALALADDLPGARRPLGIGMAVFGASAVPWSMYALAFARGQENLSALVPVSAALLVAGTVAMRPAGARATP